MTSALTISGVQTAAGETPQQSSMASDAQRANAGLTARQQRMVPIAAFAATGEIARLGPALEDGLDTGMTVSDAREILVQVYAYAGFPRSLNAIGELMKVVEARQKRGIQDVSGRLPSKPIPTGEALLAAGAANQTQLVGAPVMGPLFDFAPVIDEFLKTHLFGDIFERDNLDWRDREIATIAMLSALSSVESQLQSHIGIGINTGVTTAQLHALVEVLEQRVSPDAASRARAALKAQRLGSVER